MKHPVVILLVNVFALTSCSRALTDSSAATVVQQYVDAQGNRLVSTSADILTGGMGVEKWREWTDAGVQRILKAGLVQQRTVSVAFPNFSGEFRGQRGNWIDTLTVSTSPGRPPTVNGSLRSCATANLCWQGTLDGFVIPKGPSQFTLRVTQSDAFGTDVGQTNTLRATLVRGSPDVIRAAFDNQSYNFSGELVLGGRILGSEISQNVYVYGWTDKLPKDTFTGSMLKLGHLVIDSCDHLLLATETTAKASCKTHVKLTPVAETIFGSGPTEQPLRAQFGKQPDGTWICTGIDYAPPGYDILR